MALTKIPASMVDADIGTMEALSDLTSRIEALEAAVPEATGTDIKAMVNFDGTQSPPVIRSSLNVSGVARNGDGDYTITFASALPDSDYLVLGSGGGALLNNLGVWVTEYATKSTTQLRIQTSTWSTTRTLLDVDQISVIVI